MSESVLAKPTDEFKPAENSFANGPGSAFLCYFLCARKES